MKHMIYGIGLACMAILVIAAGMAVSGKNVRENEMDKALNTAVEQTLEQLQQRGGYEIGEEQELIADFQQALLLHISSDSEIEVRILTADAPNGILDVEVTEKYKTVKGTKNQAVCRKTVLLEHYSGKKSYRTVVFQVEGRVYEKYSVYEGSTVPMPKEPEKQGSTFKGWQRQESGEMLKDDIIVQEDLAFQAVFQ